MYLKRINRLYLLLLVLLIIVCILAFFQVERRINASDSSLILVICTIITTGGGLLSIGLIIKELSASAKIANADFILKLNTDFMKSEEIMKVYRKLEESFSDYSQDPGKWKNNKYFDVNDQVAMASYLTYFETIFYLLERKFIELNEINDMFARRFFLAVHNPEFQGYLIPNNKYYKNIFLLYDRWRDFRIEKMQQPILLYDKYSLDGKNGKKLKVIYIKSTYNYEVLTNQDKLITCEGVVKAVKDGNLWEYLTKDRP